MAPKQAADKRQKRAPTTTMLTASTVHVHLLFVHGTR